MTTAPSSSKILIVAVSSSPVEILANPVMAVELVAVKLSGLSSSVSSSIEMVTVAVVLPAGNVALYGPTW